MISQNKISLFSGIMGTLALILYGVSAVAATTEVKVAGSEAKRRVLEEITVTAQKRSENLQDVPISISAFSGEELKNIGANTALDLQFTTPGLVYNQLGGGQIYLRGVGTQYATNGLESSVATYIDDRYVSRGTAGVVDFLDVERVEVLKGPQGTLFGRNTAGGAIRVITKDVSDEFEGKITGRVGNYDYYSVSGVVNLPISDNFGARIAAMTKQRDGFADNLSPSGSSEWDDADYKFVRGKLRWDMSDKVTARLSLMYLDEDDNAGIDPVILPPVNLATGIVLGGITGRDTDEVATTIQQKNVQEEFAAQLRIDAGLDRFDLVSITTYSDRDQTVSADADATSLPLFDFFIPEGGDEFSQELQLISNSDSNWEWMGGIFYYKYEYENDLLVLDGLSSPSASFGVQEVKTTSWAVFGQTTWHFDEHWSLTLGGRWTEDKKEVENVASANAPTLIPVPFSDEDDWSEFTPRATLQYSFENSQVYLTYATGFKSGGFNNPAAINVPLEPETLKMLELGFKGEFLEQRLRLDTAFYYYEFKDLQVSRASAGTNISTTENASDSKIFGFDLSATWLVTDRMILQTGLNVLDTEYKDYPEANAKIFNAVLTGNPAAPGMGVRSFDADGQDMLRAPDWSAFISAEYEFRVGDATVPLRIAYSYKDEYDFDFIADPLSKSLRQDGYGLLSARLSYIAPGEKWEFTLWGNNLTDEEYFDNIVANGLGIRGIWGQPRTYGLDVSFKF